MAATNGYCFTKPFACLTGGTNSSWQWQPITVGKLAKHDPSPPITIDTYAIVRLRLLLGIGH